MDYHNVTPKKKSLQQPRRRPQLISPLNSVTKLAKPPLTPRSPPLPPPGSQPWLPAGNSEIPFSPVPLGQAALASRVTHYQHQVTKLEASITRHEPREAALVEENTYLQDQLNKFMSRSTINDEIDSETERTLLVRDVTSNAESLNKLSDANKIMTDLANVLQKKLAVREAELTRLEDSLQKATNALKDETQKRELIWRENEELKTLVSDLHTELESTKVHLLSTKKSLESAHLREADTSANLSSNSNAVAEFASRSIEAVQALEQTKEELVSQQRIIAELRKQLASVIFESKSLRSHHDEEIIQFQDQIFELERLVRVNTLEKASDKAISASYSSTVTSENKFLQSSQSLQVEDKENLQKSLTLVTEQYNDSQRSLETCRLELKHLNVKINELEGTCTTMKAKVTRAESETERHLAHAKQLEQTVQECDSRIDAIFQTVTQLGYTASSAEDSNRNLTIDKSNLQNEKESLVTQLETLTLQRDSSKQQLADAEAQLERAHLNLEAEKNETKSLKRNISSLRSEVDRLRTDLAKAQIHYSSSSSSMPGQSFVSEGLWRQKTSSGNNASVNSSMLSVTDLQQNLHSTNQGMRFVSSSSISPNRPLALRVTASPTHGMSSNSNTTTLNQSSLSLTSDVAALVGSLKRDLEEAKRRLHSGIGRI
jgi:chromosome segregation ATPase